MKDKDVITIATLGMLGAAAVWWMSSVLITVGCIWLAWGGIESAARGECPAFWQLVLLVIAARGVMARATATATSVRREG